MTSTARVVAVILALILASSLFTLLSLNAKDPAQTALNYIKHAPTFSFDGITSTLEIKSVDVETAPTRHIVTIEFVCLHSGYGNRQGKPTLQVLTPHIAEVTVTEGQVTKAVIDARWDEVNQNYLTLTSKDIEDIAVAWLMNAPTFRFDGIPETIKVVDIWQAQTFAAPSFWQVTIEFDSRHPGYGDREGQVLPQVITHHVARIHVTEGVVTLAIIDEIWDELEQEEIPSIYTSDNAVNTAVSFLLNAPTFRFDGLKDTVKILKVDTLRMPNTYEVTIEFTCAYPGYGDRTGNLTYGPSQRHEIKVLIQNNAVTWAIIDGVWDEILQKRIG